MFYSASQKADSLHFPLHGDFRVMGLHQEFVFPMSQEEMNLLS